MGIKVSNFIYTIIDALSFRVSGETKNLTVIEKEGKIQALREDTSGLNLYKGLTVEIDERPYLINLIEEVKGRRHISYKLSMAKRTKSSLFILPMLGEERRMFFWDDLLINCFIGNGDDKNCIFLLYRFSSDAIFLEFEQALTKFSTFKRREDPGPEYVMFVFDVPKKDMRNYRKFVNGKYSTFTGKYKQKILDFHDMEVEGEIGQVLYQDPKRREFLEKLLQAEIPEGSELMSVLDPNVEVFNIKNYELKPLL